MISWDVEAWVRARFGLSNEGGGRGRERGILTFSCPLCGDERDRAWVNAEKLTAGCFNDGCVLQGGRPLSEFARLAEGGATRAGTLAALRDEFPAPESGSYGLPPQQPPAYADWCRLPAEVRWMGGAVPGSSRSLFEAEALRFCDSQWRVDGAEVGLGYCVRGRYAYRVILPVWMGGQVVAFQARSYRGGEPKYLTSRCGSALDPLAECGRPAEALLYNLDALKEGKDVVIVEGAGDVLRWGTGGVARLVESFVNDPRRAGADGKMADSGRGGVLPGRGRIAVALLGTALTGEKASLLAAKRPGRVIVALDADAEEGARLRMVRELWAWGLDAVPGWWSGGKDAGDGARLVIGGAGGLAAVIARRFGHARP